MDLEEKKIDKLEECFIKDMKVHDFNICQDFILGAIKQEGLIKSESEDIMTDRDTSTTNLAEALNMEYSADSVFEECKNHIKLEEAKSEYMELPDSIDIKEDIVLRTIKQEELIITSETEDCWEDNTNNKDITTTNSIESLKMENSDDDDAFEEKESDIKLEGTNYKDMDMPDSIDTKDDVIESSIKQEALMIKLENADSCEDNTNLKETKVNFEPCQRSVSTTEEGSTIADNISFSQYNLKTKHCSNLKSHRKQSKNVALFSCGECDYRTNNNDHLKAHNLRHRYSSEIDMFTCGKCNFQTMQKQNLKRHMLQHKSAPKIKMFRCGECGFQTKYKVSLNYHKLQHKSPIEIEMFSCGECNYQTRHKQYLRIHKLRKHKTTATEVEMLSCGTCGYQTNMKDDLKRHILRHRNATEAEMFSCGECDYQTKYKASLKTHNLRHKSTTEIEMFSCEECDYQAKVKYHVTKHMLRHKNATDIKMFSCGECSYQTKYQKSLKTHKLRHRSASEVEMFSCEECDYQTKNKSHLKRHTIRHKCATEIEMFSCGECGFQTKYRSTLKMHVIRHKSATEIEMFKQVKA